MPPLSTRENYLRHGLKGQKEVIVMSMDEGDAVTLHIPHKALYSQDMLLLTHITKMKAAGNGMELILRKT